MASKSLSPKIKIVSTSIPHTGKLQRGTEEYNEYNKQYQKLYYQEKKKYSSLITLKNKPSEFITKAIDILYEMPDELPPDVATKILEIVELMKPFRKTIFITE